MNQIPLLKFNRRQDWLFYSLVCFVLVPSKTDLLHLYILLQNWGLERRLKSSPGPIPRTSMAGSSEFPVTLVPRNPTPSSDP